MVYRERFTAELEFVGTRGKGRKTEEESGRIRHLKDNGEERSKKK